MASPSTAAMRPNQVERRATARYQIVGEALVNTYGDSPATARVRNISLGGCCLELSSPEMTVGTPVHLHIAINGTEFELPGRVANVRDASLIGFAFQPRESR